MNKDNIRKVIEAINFNDHRIGFNMSLYFDKADDTFRDMSGNNFEKTACIAGHAAHLAGVTLLPGSGPRIFERAWRFLGIPESQASQLFTPPKHKHGKASLKNITAEHAIRCLENLMETGEVDWISTDPCVEWEDVDFETCEPVEDIEDVPCGEY